MKKGLVLMAALVAITTGTAVGVATSFHKNSEAVLATGIDGKCEGHERYVCRYDKMEFYYSDGLFEKDPYTYDQHLATLSSYLVNASDNYVENGYYGNGAKTIKQAYTDMKFKYIKENDWYTTKPRTDTIGDVIGYRGAYIKRLDTYATIIMMTIRSAGYGLEWASNVKLGTQGEAEGFKEAANQAKEDLEKYLDRYSFRKDVNDGNVIFYVQGFSRGGATANLLAKRIVDDYQPLGNEIYAYCMEAPQGGVASEEKEGRNYHCIHNVINVNDIVPYVAPSAMGFKRYGLDHYVFDDQNPVYRKSNYFYPNNESDNAPLNKPSDEYKKEVEKQLAILVPNAGARKEHMPHILDRYELSLTSFSINKTCSSPQQTSSFLKETMDSLANSVGRKGYAKDMQNAVRNFMIYVKGDSDFGTVAECLGKMDAVNIITDVVVKTVKRYFNSIGVIETIWDWITGDDSLEELMEKNLNKDVSESAADMILLRANVVASLDTYYPGKNAQARKDIVTIVSKLLNGIPSIDDAVTLFKNVDGLLQNHSFIQSIAYMRAADNWYNQ